MLLPLAAVASSRSNSTAGGADFHYLQVVRRTLHRSDAPSPSSTAVAMAASAVAMARVAVEVVGRVVVALRLGDEATRRATKACTRLRERPCV